MFIFRYSIASNVLESERYDIIDRDLKKEIVGCYKIKMLFDLGREAYDLMILESLNQHCFEADVKLMEIAKKYKENLDLQLGFDFYQYSFCSSKDVLKAL